MCDPRPCRGIGTAALGFVLAGTLLCLSLAGPAAAQVPAKTTPNKTTPAPTAAPKAERPAPEAVDLVTKDGVLLKATFFPGTKGNQSVPVVLLHMYKGSRNEYGALADGLQQMGHAVLVPDLRGHGQSTQVRSGGRPLEAETMPPLAFAGMIEDLETCKRFLVDKNDAGELNIEKLCIVGAEMSTPLALAWARLDWSWPVLATGKQGQDVKALVLLSPEQTFRGLQARPALADPSVRSQLSIFLLVGKDDPKALRGAKGIFTMLGRFHPERSVDLDPGLQPPDPNAAPDKAPHCTLFFLPVPTKLQGTKLLHGRGLTTAQWIAWFIKVRLADQPYPWKKRGTHLGT
ncbi:MAG: hypothetical protein JW809_12460 [Pirellulales bacterium]|nr:hypothetical protein [Pirellulales bacterium]